MHVCVCEVVSTATTTMCVSVCVRVRVCVSVVMIPTSSSPVSPQALFARRTHLHAVAPASAATNLFFSPFFPVLLRRLAC